MSGKADGRKGGSTPRDGQGISRRTFLEIAGLVAGVPALLSSETLMSTALPPYRPTAHGTYKPGIQLYTLRDLLEQDTEGTLAGLAKIGYTEVELAGTYGKAPTVFRAILDRVGLKAPSGHYGVPEVTTKIDETIAGAKILGHKYVTLADVAEDMRSLEGYHRAARMLNLAGAQLQAAGLQLGYHNHDFEFQKVDGNRTGYDILLQATNAKLVVFELDLFWIRKAGGDALTLFSAYRDRFRLVHIKDMAADGAMVDVGQGVMDWPTLLAAAKKSGVKQFLVEHDESKDPLNFAKVSYDYVAGLR